MVTGWTENASIRKQQPRVLVSAEHTISRAPTNGSEFINHDVAEWFQARDIAQTRSRPYRKNDQAIVESKNDRTRRA
ncbi:MAG: hypothetical protein AB7V43_14755 [Acidimicrobiia bacterium]